MKRYNLTVPKNYEKNGEERTTWLQLGTMAVFPAQTMPDGTRKEASIILELNHMPNIQIRAFEIVPKEQTPSANVAGRPATVTGRPQNVQSTAPAHQSAPIDYPEDDINPADIPF